MLPDFLFSGQCKVQPQRDHLKNAAAKLKVPEPGRIIAIKFYTIGEMVYNVMDNGCMQRALQPLCLVHGRRTLDACVFD